MLIANLTLNRNIKAICIASGYKSEENFLKAPMMFHISTQIMHAFLLFSFTQKSNLRMLDNVKHLPLLSFIWTPSESFMKGCVTSSTIKAWKVCSREYCKSKYNLAAGKRFVKHMMAFSSTITLTARHFTRNNKYHETEWNMNLNL